MAPKRLCSFTDKLQNEFPFIKKVKTDNNFDVQCTVYLSTFSVSHGGKTDITYHMKSNKHKIAQKAALTSGKVNNFFTPLKANDESLKLAAKEITLAFHTVMHNHSFNSMTCTADLIRLLFNEKKFTCAKTKTRDLIVNILAPFAMENTIEGLKKANYISVLVDASNHKSVKLVPVIVRYFNPKNGIKNDILDFSSLPGETAELIHNKIVSVLKKFELEEKIISFSGDNTNTNFGGIARKGKNNVFLKLKNTLKRNILGLGCCAHVIHNSIQYAADSLPIDIEIIVCKIFGYFHIYTVRVETLKEFCSFVDVQYKEILAHSKTRWLSLYPAIERIIEMFSALKSYFLSQNNCPNILKTFFKNETSILWLNFLQSQLKTINIYIKIIENQKLCAVELILIMEKLTTKLKNKKDDFFLPSDIEALLVHLEESGEIIKSEFKETCTKFYDLCINYITDWTASNQHIPELNSLTWVCLSNKDEINWSNIKPSISFLKLNFNITLNEEELYEQFLRNKTDEWQCKTSEEKWLSIFKSFKENNIDYSMLLKIVEFAFALPGSNAAVERIFSLMNSCWTKSRGNLCINTVEATLVIKTNLENKPCQQFYEDISKNKDLLIRVHKTAKYSTTNQKSETEASGSQT
ncbi:unnamed protein product [Macrosiphum euphorbiae]|uniref:HAT C-terminal dimerisation domain-containing protein n=1 Tax=Macrosiphum euphorbiae TaxID=13131 RepID=A0AAV0WYY7_9HEMI|nr:unnamed protein product [Macrosiphum euphorbiae]